MSDELADFIGEDEVVTEATVETTANSQETEATAEVQMDTTPEKGVNEEVPPTSSHETEVSSESEMVPLAAKQAEKERRKKAEDELARLRTELEQLKKPEEVPDAYLEPDKAIEHATAKIRAEMRLERINQSEARAKSKYADYDAKFEVFQELVAKQPHLLVELQNDYDPAEFVYQTVGKYKKMQEIESVGDLSAFEQKIRAEERARVEAEMKSKGVKVPPDLSVVRSAGGDPVDVIADGDDGLEQLLNR